MKRHGQLFESFASFENLPWAATKARRRKRHKPNVASFHADLENELIRLQRELQSLIWHPGPYYAFRIREPKPRIISAAAYRDRVMHHALCNVIEPLFERGFIFDSYANRRGKGTHRAITRCGQYMRRFPYVLQCDIRKYFPSIDHAILKTLIRRKLKDERLLVVVERLIDGSNLQEPVYELFPGDDLLTPLERRKGLPIGNLTSQFFANLYLNPRDHFVMRALRCQGYLRYSDDFLLFSHDKAELHDFKPAVADFLADFRLRLHENISQVCPVSNGISFLGFRHFPTHRRLCPRAVQRQRRRLKALQTAYAVGEIELAQVRASISAWIGHARHGDTWRLGQRLFEDWGDLPSRLSAVYDLQTREAGLASAVPCRGLVADPRSSQSFPSRCCPSFERCSLCTPRSGYSRLRLEWPVLAVSTRSGRGAE